MNKNINYKSIIINGKEIKVPQDYDEVIIDKEGNIKLIKQAEQHSVQNVTLRGVDIPEVALSEVESIKLPVDKELFKKNVAEVSRADYIFDLAVGGIVSLIFLLIGIAGFLPALPFGIYGLWYVKKLSEPILEVSDKNKRGKGFILF